MVHYGGNRGDHLKPKRKMLVKLMGMMLAVTFTILCIGQAKPAYAADTSTQLSVSIETVSGKPGDTVEVPVKVSNVPAAGINNFNFAVTYDTSALDLVYKTDTNGQLITDGDLPIIDVSMNNTVIPTATDFSCSQLNDGMLDFLYEDNTEGDNPIKNNGTLFTLKFKIRDTAQPGDYAVSQVDYSEGSYLGTMFSINDSSSTKGITNVIPVFSAGKVTVSSDITIAKLNNEIASAGKMAAIPVGTKSGNCSSQDAIDALKTAIANANQVALNASSTQQDINNAYNALLAAESKVEDAIVPQLLSSVDSVTENNNFDQIIQITIDGTGDFASSLSPANITLGGDFQGLTVESASIVNPSTDYIANIELKGDLKYTTGTGTITVKAAGWSGTCAPCDLTASINVIKAGTVLAVVSSTPSKDATNVPVDSPITVKFNQGIKAGTVFNGITLIDNSTNTTVTTNNTIINDTLTITPTANLKNSTTYTVSIPAGAINNITDTSFANAYTFSFTTAVASPIQLSIGSASALPGSTIEIPITAANIPASGVDGAQFTVKYDPTVLTYLSGDSSKSVLPKLSDGAGGTLTGLSISEALGELHIMYGDPQSPDNPLTSSGLILSLKFQINLNASVNTTSAITFDTGNSTTPLKLVNPVGETPIPDVQTSNGIVKVISYVKGDVNGDGSVDVSDYNLVKQMILGKITDFMSASDPTKVYQYGKQAADVNGDSSIDVSDYNLIKQIILGKITY